MTGITQKAVTVGKCAVNVLKSGNPDGRAVLLLHGMSFQAKTWQDLGTLDALGQAGFNVVAADMPGFGLTPKCGTGPDEVVDGLIKAEKLTRPVVVGPSMGGRLALNFALEHPELVGGLVLVGCVGVEDNRERLHTIKVPALIVWGTKDHIAPFATAELLHKEIKGSKLLVIEGARHPAYLDDPALWHRELLGFLRESFN